ncbi:Hypothetical predicted protein [Pelobates cultripes]|uniref:Uncharacterized protein n=1 Tax=Pelobates cultripes TaxID=61616 RepID=A0AAD1TMG0_PELCU|nr:Hypothetical predicted protein [Pelobates cultripes]
MTYCYEGDAYIAEVKRRLVEYDPDPSEEVIVRIMQELDEENQAARECEFRL